MVLDTQDEIDSSVQLDYRGRDRIALTDAQYVGGQGVPDCLDSLVLLYLTQHLTNTRFDSAMARGGVRRYVPHLCFIRGEDLVGIANIDARDSRRFARAAQAHNGALDPADLDAAEKELFVRLGDEMGSLLLRLREEGEADLRSRRRWTRILEIQLRHPRLDQLRRHRIEEELRELAVTTPVLPIQPEIKIERRWLLDRNHPELYQQNHRKLFGKVPSWVYYKAYNDLRRLQARNADAPVEDPYAGGRPELLDPDDAPGQIRIGRLDEFGLATLAEYVSARAGYDYGRVSHWYTEMSRRARPRGLTGLDADRWIERNTFWITPSCQQEFLSTLATRLRGPDLSAAERGEPALVADRLCAAVDSFSHIKHRYELSGRAINWESSEVEYATVEELRDMVRDNENFAQSRANASAYDAGFLDEQRAARARDSGVGGRRSGALWWHDLKLRLLWCLFTRRSKRKADGSFFFYPRYSPEELSISDEDERIDAFNQRRFATIPAATLIIDPTCDRRPADSAIFARFLARKASVTRQSNTIIDASLKATSGGGYPRDELEDDLGLATDDASEYEAIRYEMAWFVDPRETMAQHRGIWSWYLASQQDAKTTIVDRRIASQPSTFFAHRRVLRAIYQRQSTTPILEALESLASSLEADRVHDMLSPLRRLYEQFPSRSRMERGGVDGGKAPIELWFDGEDLGLGRDDIERIIERYRRRAILWMRRRAAEMTYINGARQFTPAVFSRWRDDGFPWRVGDDSWSIHLYREMARQAWLSGIYDTLVGVAEVASVTGIDLLSERNSLESLISARKLDAFYATGKFPGGRGLDTMYWDGEPIRATQSRWVLEWVEGHANLDEGAPDFPNANKVVSMILARNKDGQLRDDNWPEIERFLTEYIIPPWESYADVSPRDKARIEAVKEVWSTVRNIPIW